MSNSGNKKKNLLIYAHYYIPDTASTGQIMLLLFLIRIRRILFIV